MNKLLADYIKKNQNKKLSNTIGSILCLIISLLFLYMHIYVYPGLTENDLIQQPVSYIEVKEFIGKSASDNVKVKTLSETFTIENTYYIGQYTTTQLAQELRKDSSAIIWTPKFKPSRVIGIKSNNVDISPAVGIDKANSSRIYTLLGVVGFFLVGAVGLWLVWLSFKYDQTKNDSADVG
ncbi:hypothetical protein L6Q79_16070 [bacterium]|nr:hypothetical protein [Candidatus Paceibacterota bacterium]MCK6544185.1 hypothetical protein [bacterium]